MGIATGKLHDATKTLADRSLTSESSQARTPTRSAPNIRVDRTDTAPVGVDDHVPDLAGEAVGAADQVAAGNHSSADAGTQRDHHHVGVTPGHADLPLGGGRARCVVADLDEEPESFGQHPADLEVGDVDQVRRRLDHTRSGDHARHTDAERVGDTERAGELGERVDERLGARRRRPALLLDDLAGLVEHDAEALRTPDVDAETARTHDSARTFSSRTVLRIRTSARRLTNPGSGTTRSMMRS